MWPAVYGAVPPGPNLCVKPDQAADQVRFNRNDKQLACRY